MELEIDPMKPRKLTLDEIEDIVSVIPNIKNASQESGEFNRKSLVASLSEQLREIYLTPLAIEDMKEEIMRQFEETIIKPGSVVGVTAADALGQPITQMALNTFHQAGSSKNVSYGIEKITELLNASTNVKQPSVTVHFKNTDLTFDDIIISKRPELTNISVKDIVLGIPDIEEYDQIMYDKPWWYGAFQTIINNEFKALHVLRLKLNVNMLYSYKITTKDVADTISNGQPVVCVYSPLNIGIVDVYPDENSIREPLKDMGTIIDEKASLVFLQRIILPSLDKLYIKGVPGIVRLYPVEASVWQIVKEEVPILDEDRTFHLILNRVRMLVSGVTFTKLIKLLRSSNIKVLKIGGTEESQYIKVQTDTGESPTQIVNDLIKKDKEDEREYENTKRKERARIIRRPATDISRAANVVYADSDGSTFTTKISTLRTLLSRPDVEDRFTYSNNVHEIKEVLGIEAARNFLIQEFSTAIENQGYINSRHIVLLVDYMTSLGNVSGITFSGVKRHNIGALEQASFEQAMDTFKEASGFGQMQDLEATSAAIYVGQKAMIGTGYNENFMDSTNFKELEKQINFNPDMVLDINAFNDAISTTIDITTGVSSFFLEGAEEEMFAGNPILPELQLSTVLDPPGIESLNHIVGPIIRAPQLDNAANLLNQAPCIRPPKIERVIVKGIPSTIETSDLPFAVPTGPITETQPLPGSFEVTRLGLPSEVLTEVERVSKSQPTVLIPVPEELRMEEPVIEEIPKITIRKEPVFDLSDFMGEDF